MFRIASVVALCCLLAVAVADPKWSIISDHVATILSGVGFSADGKIGFAAGGQDGEGPIILKSTDAGSSWAEVPHAGFSMMFLDTAVASPTSAVVGGVGFFWGVNGVEFTNDGQNFLASKELDYVEETQNVEVIRGTNKFALTGEFDKINGVAVSSDGGENYDHFDIGVDGNAYGARYGAYPSANTWYITAGSWPAATAPKTIPGRYVAMSERVGVAINPAAKKMKSVLNKDIPEVNGGYTCVVAKTVDGGKTFTKVFQNDTTFYPNGISCPTENDCWFVAEGTDGIKLFHTADGGKTWEVQFKKDFRTYSLMAVEFIDKNEGFLLGGEITTKLTGHIFHTRDGGKTWDADTLPNVYANRGYFINKNLGYATAFTTDGASSILKWA